MPDAERHCICRRCQKWFEPNEGRLMAPEATGPLGAMRSLQASFDSSVLRFQCHRCSRVRRATQIAIWATFLTLLGVVLLLEKLGWIQ
jgi:hypothetical protein